MKRMSARLFNPIRFVTASFDRSYIGSQEKEQYKNIITMRNFIKDLIIAKREEIKANPKLVKADFLSILVEDELYKGDFKMIIDECISFMIAATQTTAVLVSETLFRLTQDKSILQKVRSEMKDKMGC